MIWHFTCMGCVQISRSSAFVLCSNQGINQWITPKGLARWLSPLRTRNEANGRGKYQNPRQTHASCALPGLVRTPQMEVHFLGCRQEKHYTNRTLQAAPCKPSHWTVPTAGFVPLDCVFVPPCLSLPKYNNNESTAFGRIKPKAWRRIKSFLL